MAATNNYDEVLKPLWRAVSSASRDCVVGPLSQTLSEHLLHVAVLGGNTAILTLLLESGDLPVDAPATARHGPHHGYTPLALAASRNDGRMVEMLLAHGAQINLGHRWKPLTAAVVRGCVEAVRVLLEHGADTEIPGGRHGDLPLVCAVRCNEDSEILRMLLEHGAQPDALNGRRESALYVATSLSNLEAIAILIACGADVNARDAMDRAAIHAAADDHVIKVLIAEGADVDAADRMGKTALHRVALSVDTQTPTTLLAHGASALVQDEHGLTPLCYAVLTLEEAVTQDRKEVVALILEKVKGADGGRANLDLAFYKALLTAARGSKWTIARLLAQASSSLEARDADGRTLLSHAVECGDIAFIKLLLECGAAAGSAEFDGRTLLQLTTEPALGWGG